MKKRQKTLIVAGTLAVAMTLAACGGGGEGNGEEPGDEIDWSAAPEGQLDSWSFNNADDVGQARLDHAAAQVPDVEVVLDPTGFDAQKFTTRIASGDIPDIVQMDRRFAVTYAAQELVMPLDECFAAHGIVPNEHWYPAVAEDVLYEGKYWGVPQFYQPPAIIVNTEVTEAAGVALEDIDTSNLDVLLPAIEAMYEEEGGNPTVLGFDTQAHGQTALWILGMGGQLVDENGAPTLDDPSNLKGIEVLQQLADAQGGYPAMRSFTDTFDFFGENNQYVANQVGAQINAQWYPNVLSPYNDEITIAAVPFRGADGEPFAVAGGTVFVIPVGAENPVAACAWVINTITTEAWLAAGEARAATIAENDGLNTGLFTGSPEADQQIREQYVEESGTDFDQVISTYYEVVDYGQTFGASPVGQEVATELTNAVVAALLGDKTPEQAMADAQDVAMRAYEQVTK